MDKLVNIINMMNEYSGILVVGLTVITFLLFIIVLILLGSVNKLNKRYKKLLRGSEKKNLEDLINSNLDNIEDAISDSQEAIRVCNELKEQIKGCVNKVSIVRYKAFENVGSDLSFSIAILNDYNDGVIITGIYSRQDSTTYAKPVDKGISRYELSQEEIQALNEAMSK